MKERRILTCILQILFIFLLAIAAIFTVAYCTVLKRPAAIPHHCVAMNEWVRVYDDGTEEKIELPVKIDSDSEEMIVIKSIIPDECEENDNLAFFSICDVQVYVDDELRLDFNHDEVGVRGGVVKEIWQFVPVSSVDSGKTVKIVCWMDEAGRCEFDEIYLGDSFGIALQNVKEQGIVYIAAALLVLLSIFLILIGCVVHRAFHHKVVIIDLAIGLLLAAVWVQFGSKLNQFIFDNRYIDGVISYMSILLVPYPVISYVDSMQKMRYTKMLNCVKTFSIIYAFVFCFSHFAEIYDFAKLNSSLIAGHSLMIAAVLVSIVIDIVGGHIREYYHMAIGAIVFLAASLLEVINLTLLNWAQTGAFFILGLYALLIAGIVQQIHELIEAERTRRQALEANEQKTAFLANMSHEIRTPINSILGMNEMILRECNDPIIREYSGNVAGSGKMLLGLVNDILDFSKIEAGRMNIIETEYHTVEMIADVETILKDRSASKNLKCRVDVDRTIPSSLFGDDFHIRQIVINLISNAVKYTNEGTIGLKISVTPSVNDGYVDLRFAVSDTGVGIRRDNLDKLFETFTRIDEGKSRSIEGTGLGLSIVKKLVELMSGTVRVESEYGIGSTFTVEIPQKVIDNSPIGERGESVGNSRADYRYHEMFRAPQAEILVVDDNAVNLKVVKELLKATQIKIDTASGGRECIMKCRNVRYDLILMDHRMPDPDGIETLHLLRDDFEGLNADTEVIVLTANAYTGLKELYESEGFADYLTKPVDPIMLESCVMRHLPRELIVKNFEQEKSADKSENEPIMAQSFPERMRRVVGMDYDATLQKFGANEQFMETLLQTIVSDGRTKIGLMRKYLAEHKYSEFGIEAHAAKSTMATIFAVELSEHAKKHEFASKEGRYDYIDEDGEKFLNEYSDMLNRIESALEGEGK